MVTLTSPVLFLGVAWRGRGFATAWFIAAVSGVGLLWGAVVAVVCARAYVCMCVIMGIGVIMTNCTA